MEFSRAWSLPIMDFCQLSGNILLKEKKERGKKLHVVLISIESFPSLTRLFPFEILEG